MLAIEFSTETKMPNGDVAKAIVNKCLEKVDCNHVRERTEVRQF
jgi:hypothetical protein